jgi:hypothetical protein
MVTAYSPILKLALPVQGELSGTWGDVVNDNITSMVEQAIAGRAVIDTWTTNSHTLTTANGTTSESRCAMLEFTDTGTALSGAGTVICPTLSKIYIAKNASGQNVTLKTSGGTGILVPNGRTMFLFCDGTNVVEAVTSTTSLQLGTSTIVTAVLDEDDMASDSATSLATQQSIKAYVDSQVGTVDTLAEILAIGNTTGGTGLIISSGDTLTVTGDIDANGTIKLDGNYPVGTGNVALGDTALDDGSLSGTYNTAIGNGSLTLNTSGGGNTSVGGNSLDANTTGNYNTGMGYFSLSENTTGSNSVGIGRDALRNNTTANNNTAVGYQSLYANTTGTENTAVGNNAGAAITTGREDTIIGSLAGKSLTDADYNTAIGYRALEADTLGSKSTAVGRGALLAQNFTSATDALNTAVGFNAGAAVTTGTSQHPHWWSCR